MSTGLIQALDTMMRKLSLSEALVLIIFAAWVSAPHSWLANLPEHLCLLGPTCLSLPGISSGTHKASFSEEAAHFLAGDSRDRPCDEHSKLYQVWESPHRQGPWWCQYPNSGAVTLVKFRESQGL